MTYAIYLWNYFKNILELKSWLKLLKPRLKSISGKLANINLPWKDLSRNLSNLSRDLSNLSHDLSHKIKFFIWILYNNHDIPLHM